MLLGTLFFVERIDTTDFSVAADVRIEKLHAVFEGHFPGQPVLPGVCMLQLVKELVEQATAKAWVVHTASNMKFLTMLDPNVHPQIQGSIILESVSDDAVSLTATLFAGEVTFFKLKAALKSA